MNRNFCLAVLLIGMGSGPSLAGESYWVRIEMVGYVDRPAIEEPVERTLRSLEVLAEPDTEFHASETPKTEPPGASDSAGEDSPNPTPNDDRFGLLRDDKIEALSGQYVARLCELFEAANSVKYATPQFTTRKMRICVFPGENSPRNRT